MIILGINYLSESTVSLIKNGKLIFAISEERINRKKNWYGIPHRSIKIAKKIVKNKIDHVVTCGLSALNNMMPNDNEYKKKEIIIGKSNLPKKIKNRQIKFLKKRRDHEDNVINKRTLQVLNILKKEFKNINIYDHHTAHAASAAFYSNYKSCYVLTIDGWGDDASSKIFKFNKKGLKLISQTNTFDSLGYFYGSITKLLGFKPHQHEGKILGLAAYGKPKRAYKEISKMISFDKKNLRFVGNYENGIYQANYHNKNLNYLKQKFSKEDISAAAQKILEENVIKCVDSLDKKKFNIALAGGVFANVKLNQKIMELEKVKDLFIFPNMGDGGLSTGAAALEYYDKSNKKPIIPCNYYLGLKYTDSEILNEIKKNKLSYTRPKNLPFFVAKKLSEEKIVAHFNDKMEFGPRALGNRSILCSAKKNEINIELNKKLNRTEFMPFAPIIMKKYLNTYFNFKKGLKNFEHMTMTTKCRKIMIKSSPAAVHIDETARPQSITKKSNKRIFDILKEYKKITGIPVLINTSFNLHEEPIVCSPNDAIRAFKKGKIDYLVLNNYIIEKK